MIFANFILQFLQETLIFGRKSISAGEKKAVILSSNLIAQKSGRPYRGQKDKGKNIKNTCGYANANTRHHGQGCHKRTIEKTQAAGFKRQKTE